jgi:hypothetical protein
VPGLPGDGAGTTLSADDWPPGACRSTHAFKGDGAAMGRVRCVYAAGHPGDGSNCFAYHLGPPETWSEVAPPPGQVRQGGGRMRRVWTDQDPGAKKG